jgi:hypothetical protein
LFDTTANNSTANPPSTMSRQLMLRLLRSQSLPTLTQGSTLTIRSSVPHANVSIRSEWRDDGHVSLYRPSKDECYRSSPERQQTSTNQPSTAERYVHMAITQEEDRITSLSGRIEPHVSIQLEEGTAEDKDESFLDGLKEDASMMVDDNVQSSSDTLLSIIVPEKVNIECSLVHGGSIFIHNKVEGDVRLVTSHGNVHVQKIRGHSIDIQAAAPPPRKTRQVEEGGDGVEHSNTATIYSSDLLEASILTLKIPAPSLGRVRAKRIHAKTVHVEIGTTNGGSTTYEANDAVVSTAIDKEMRPSLQKLDVDDSGALCDISSLYSSGGAEIQVEASWSSNTSTPIIEGGRAVRIKSNHGPVVVKVSATKPRARDDMTGCIPPLVELGGVNGSCEVFVNAAYGEEHIDTDTDADWTSCQVHFDSISPHSVSLVQVGQGNVGITLDRKVESDMRLLSASNTKSLDMEAFLADLDCDDDDNDQEEHDHLLHALSELDNFSTKRVDKQCISIRTNAFTERERYSDPDQLTSPTFSNRWKNIEYIDGWVENKSGEPDSRFDQKLRGSNSSGGGGKIRLEGAAAQALQGFQLSSTAKMTTTKDATRGGDKVPETVQRPLLAVAASGEIVVETLSWLGNIARRFGMDDTRETDDLGRTATRRGRDFAPDKE